MHIRGITKRWLINSLGLIVIILVILILSFAFVVRNYYYNGIQSTIQGHVSGISSYFSGSLDDYSRFNATAVNYVETFSDKEQMELMAFDRHDRSLITSTGFEVDQKQAMPDYELAKSSDEGAAIWTGTLNSGEKVMAITQAMYSSSGDYMGAVRYVVSLESADRKIFMSVSLLLLVGCMVIFFVVLSNTYFIRSIVKPLGKISAVARRIAQGDFKVRIRKSHDDEIGDLCDTINDMAQELGASEKMKNDFISSVSHELRTPLTAIKGWAETMKMTGPADAVTMEKGMSIIVRETERLSGIVEELLDFSRMQNKAMVLMMDKIDLLAELDEAVYMYRERAISENKHLDFEEPESISPVLADKNRMRQVFVNVFDNALKYTPEDGMVSIRVQEDEKFIHIYIVDNGCGIPAEHLPRVKDKFYKANQTQRGSGIGLAVADEIMTHHSGSLQIESEEGVGTTVIISIPKIQPDKGDQKQE